jgi:hypothetical protein
MQQCIKIFIIPYLYEAQHVSGDALPIIRSLKLHWQPLDFHTWKVVERVAGGRCQALLMFVDPCIIVQFIKKNPIRCNSVSKFLLFHIYMKLV